MTEEKPKEVVPEVSEKEREEFNEKENALLKEINELRTNPKAYAEKIEKNKQYFDDKKVYRNPEDKAGVRTEEGAEAYDEAIDFLKNKAVPVEALTRSKGLNKLAFDILTEYQKDMDAQLDLDTLIPKYGKYVGAYRQVTQFGSNRPEQIIINLVVSDGDKTRGQRDALLEATLKQAGVAFGKHEKFRYLTVVTGCTKFENTIDPDDTA